MYYLFYRGRGHSVLKSALGSALQSTLFEYTIEGLVETPSLPDLIFTPLVGAPLGIVFDETSKWLSGRDNIGARSLAYVVNPMKIIIDDRKFGFVNPLSGTFGFHGVFEPKENKEHALRLSYSNYVESPIPVGRIMTSTEVINVKQEFGGEFIMYYIRVDLPNDANDAAIYIRISQAARQNEICLQNTARIGDFLVVEPCKRILVQHRFTGKFEPGQKRDVDTALILSFY